MAEKLVLLTISFWRNQKIEIGSGQRCSARFMPRTVSSKSTKYDTAAAFTAVISIVKIEAINA